MSNIWDARSAKTLSDVHDDMYFLMSVALRDYCRSTKFICVNGSRTLEEHLRNVRTGASKAKVSRHVLQIAKEPPRYPLEGNEQGIKYPVSHAVDIMAFIDGKGTWEDSYYVELAEAIRKAAIEYDIPVRWGGCWKDLRKVTSIRKAMQDYAKNCEKQYKAGRRKSPKPFFDTGHYELPTRLYPTAAQVVRSTTIPKSRVTPAAASLSGITRKDINHSTLSAGTSLSKDPIFKMIDDVVSDAESILNKR